MALLTYSAGANREDLVDVIVNISPYDTPLFSMFGRTKATGTYHEWPEEELRDPQDNAAIEGADFTFDDAHTPTRVGNYTQILKQGYSVSETQEAVNKAGKKSDMARSMVYAMRELGTDVERAYIRNAAKVAGSASVARQLGGVQAFITTNVLDNGGTLRDLTETLLNDGIQAAWEKGGKPDTVVVCGKHKRIISGFSASSQRTIEATSKKLVATIDIYESDFGLVRVIANRWMVTDRLFILEKSRWKTAYLRPFGKKPYPEGIADRKAGTIIGELTLEARAEKANAIIRDLN